MCIRIVYDINVYTYSIRYYYYYQIYSCIYYTIHHMCIHIVYDINITTQTRES